MSAGGVEFVLYVEGAELRVLHEEMFLREAESADVEAGGVARRPGNQGPGDLEAPFLTLQIPHILAQAGVSPLLLVVETCCVVVSSGFPIGFGPAQVGLHLLGPDHLVHQLGSLWRKGFYFGLVDDV